MDLTLKVALVAAAALKPAGVSGAKPSRSKSKSKSKPAEPDVSASSFFSKTHSSEKLLLVHCAFVKLHLSHEAAVVHLSGL